MIKAVFFDIDGTLVSFKTHKLPDSTIRAIGALRKKGIKVFIATGRQFQSINNLGTLEFDGYVTLNGGYCIAGTDQPIYEHSIPKEDIDAFLDYLEAGKSISCGFVMKGGEICMNYKAAAAESLFRMLNFPIPPIRPLSDVRGKTVFQLIAFFTKAEEEEIMSVLPHCEATRWNPSFSDVVPMGSSKAIGIDKMIEHFGISLDETMAFGDGGNDTAMIRHVKIGVAMGNADKEVREVADYVTSSVDEDGIYNALKYYGVID